MNVKKKTYQEILDLIKQTHTIQDIAYDDIDYDELGLGNVKEIFVSGGCDKGSDWKRVKYFVDHDVYIEISGYYSSYDGCEFDGWDSCKQVYPRKKEITIYTTENEIN